MKKIKKGNKLMENKIETDSQIKILKVDKRSSFLAVAAELDGEFYEGVLIKGGFKNEEKKDEEKKD